MFHQKPSEYRKHINMNIVTYSSEYRKHINMSTSPKVVKPGSILARVERVLTTSPLFMYSCRQRSIKF